jgi:mannose-6-phosphate isomerase-like protein (cupin superfamily)
MRLLASFLLFAAFALPAGDPPGFHFWTASELKGFAQSLSPKINAQKIATQQLAAAGNYSFMVAHREGPGEAEYHENQADIFFVQTGGATLLYGGTLVDPKTTAPHEMRAPSIRGGMEKKLSAGDVVTIPAKMPHQMKTVDREITYFVVKVTQ